MSDRGKFVISLDFELMWGLRDLERAPAYKDNILGVWEALPKMVDLFDEYDVKATFATVGLLFADSKQEQLNNAPSYLPTYDNQNLSPFNGYFDTIGEDENHDKLHFGTALIDKIHESGQHELASHTYSHYYCLEKGQTIEEFAADIQAAQQIAGSKNYNLQSIVFPRNQYNEEYLDVLKSQGIKTYRGNENHWIFQKQTSRMKVLMQRLIRILDSYINLTGHHIYDISSQDDIVDVPSSRFLRPYSKKLSLLENQKIRRIKTSMTQAAKQKKVYHLWWHPHNFGADQKENFKNLEKILKHYRELNSKFGFESCTMSSFETKLN